MVMRVDEPRKDHMVAKIEHLVGCFRQLVSRSDLGDDPVGGKQATVDDLTPIGIVGHEYPGVANEQAAQGARSPGQPAGLTAWYLRLTTPEPKSRLSSSL